MKCQRNSKPGYKFGEQGHCYTYTPGNLQSKNSAKKKAGLQGRAIKARTDQIDNPLLSQGVNEKRLRSKLKKRPRALLYPKGIERQYEKFLLSLVREWLELYKGIVDPQLERIGTQAYLLRQHTHNLQFIAYLPEESIGVRTDDWPDELATVMGSFQVSMVETIKPVETFARSVGHKVSEWGTKQWSKTLVDTLGVDVFAREPWLGAHINSFGKENVQLITKLAEETRADIDRIINDGFKRGRRIEDIRTEILRGTDLTKGRFKKTRTRAQLIARDQVSKLNGQLIQLRQQEIGINQYIWRTAIDERVRTSHLAMEGKICDWGNAFTYKNKFNENWMERTSDMVKKHPGQDIQCRCYAEPVFEDLL